MRKFAKFVAGILVVLMVPPALALTSCRRTLQSMKCCSSYCPMLATDSGVRTASSGLGVTKAVCCSPSSQRALNFIDQRRTDNRIELVALHSRAVTPYFIVAEKHEQLHPREGQALDRPSRIILCTFLI